MKLKNTMPFHLLTLLGLATATSVAAAVNLGYIPYGWIAASYGTALGLYLLLKIGVIEITPGRKRRRRR